MKQIYVIASLPAARRVLPLCLVALSAVSSDIHQNPGYRQAGIANLTEFSSQNRQERPQVYVRPPAAYPYPRPDTYAWPGPGAVRHCVDWYATEYRPSGTVITPQMRCRWVRPR